MATLLHSETRHSYSWWWDSHISPKSSKWLQENLTDMDAKVKAMIKLIEEDADSFARRAEMYYKKRPDLMKLVEGFYRAYRALAERYYHATGELRQARQTMAEAFPNQVPFALADDTPSSSEPHAPMTTLPIPSLFDLDDLQKDGSGLFSSNMHGVKISGASADDYDAEVNRKDLQQLNDMFHVGEAGPQDAKSVEVKEEGKEYILEEDLAELSNENQNLKVRVLCVSERAGKAETELQILKKSLVKIDIERDAVLLQYQQILEKLTNLEKELSLTQEDAGELDQQESKAETEVKALKEALLKLEAEKDASLLQSRESLEYVGVLETMITAAQEDLRGLSDQATKAEAESHNLKLELCKSEVKKEAGRILYVRCLEKISSVENKISLSEENAKVLNEQSGRAQNEVKALKEELLKLNKEKEDAALQHKQCAEMISKLQDELREAQEETRQLNSDILLGSAKLESAEENCILLGKMNESLQSEADDLAQTIAMKDQELTEKQAELEKLQNSLQDEHCRLLQVEATLRNLQNLYSQFQEEQRAVASELSNGLKMLKDLELCKLDLEAEIRQLREENRSLKDVNFSSSISEKNLQGQISRLRQIKEKLEGEVKRQAEQIDALQQELHRLKDEMEDLYNRYQALMKQVEYVDFVPECVGSSVKSLQEENSRLRGSSSKDRAEKELLLKKLEHMEELLKKSSIMEISLSDVSAELERSKEKAKTLEDSCLVLNGEKSSLVTEKAALLSQLQTLTETMQKIFEKNASLENSLSCANADLEGLRAKSKSLEEFCQLLKSERSNLLTEKSALVFRLEIVEQKLENLENRFTKLEDRCDCLEKEKHSTISEVEQLRVSLGVEKQERACLVLTSGGRLSGLEDRIHHLQEENKFRKKEFEEQVDKAVNAQFDIFILQKFIEDMEEKNSSLLVECQKHVETAKYSEKLIAELEGENMMQQVETQFLLDKIDKLRMGIYQVLKALETNHVGEAEAEQNFVACVLANIKGSRRTLSESKDENQQLVIENSILTTVLKQLNLEGAELALRKEVFDQEFMIFTQQHAMLENEKDELLERTRCLDIEVTQRAKEEEALEIEIERLHVKQEGMEMALDALHEENLRVLEENQFLHKELSDLLEEKCMLEDDNNTVFLEALAVSIQGVIFKCYGIEKALELERHYQDMDLLRKAYDDLGKETVELEVRLEMKAIENFHLRESIEILKEKQHELHSCHDQFKHQMLVQQELLEQKESELSEAEQELKATQDLNTGLCQTLELLENEKDELLERTRCLDIEVTQRAKEEEALKIEIERLHVKQEGMEMAHDALHEENLRVLEENQFLHKELSDLLEEKCMLEDGNNTVFLEALAVSIQGVIFKCYGIEKALELDRLYQDMDFLHKAYDDLGKETVELEVRLEMKAIENFHLRESIEILKEKQHELHSCHDQFKHQMLVQKELLEQKESELSEAEQELKDTQDLNTGLCQTLKLLEKGCEHLKVTREKLEKQILELSQYNRSQDEVIGNLQEANQKLESDVGFLREEIEERKIREVILSSELHGRNSEFELWEAEAASFYFDLQISGIREVLFENKVQELSGLCEDLEVVSFRRSVEMEMMKEKVILLESEAERLKTQLAAYAPAVASLKYYVESLEQNLFLQTILCSANSTEEQVVTGESNILEPRDQNSPQPDGLSELQKLQSKIKVIEKLMLEERERFAMQECSKADVKLEAAVKEIEELRSRITTHDPEKNIGREEFFYSDSCNGNLISIESGPEASETRTRAQMKDIPLDQVSDSSTSGNSKRRNSHPDDQVLELCRSAEWDSSCDLMVSKTLEQASMPKEDGVLCREFEIGVKINLNPTFESEIEKELGVDKLLEYSKNHSNSNQEGNKVNVLERLASDAQKLIGLQISVQELRTKMEANKKKKSTKDVEYGRLRDQLNDVENSLLQLMDMNTELLKTVGDCPSTSDVMSSKVFDEGDPVQRKRASEQAQNSCEKIGRLQLEMQKIQYMWQKMEDEKKSQGKRRFSTSHTGIILRDFMHSRGRSRRKRKVPFIGCLRPSPKEN